MTKFDRLFYIMTKPLVVVATLTLIVLSYAYLDQSFAIAAYSYQFKTKLPWLDPFTDLGLGMLYWVFLAVLALSFRLIFHNQLWERRAWFLWLCVVIPNLVCLILKMILGRARPDLLFSSQMFGFYGFHKSPSFWSFPSGHTTTIMGLMFGLSALFPRYWVGFVLFGSFIALSRILLLKHYLSDVLMATYLALIEVGLLYYWLSTYIHGDTKR